MAINLARRRKVMDRSQKLGHCVCEPKTTCPCEALIRRNICPCAGEKPEGKAPDVALTRTVRKAGCAGKIAQGDLARLLAALPPVADPNVLVGMAAGDDAGVYRLDDKTALVQTVDVFTPVVDDPYLFGQIAAANSLSDVYAMGGRPLTALSIVGFPIDDLDGAILEAMLRGGMDKLAEAGCALVGGHSINDVEPKMGFAVTGLIDPSRVVERGAARPGDRLVLTKPLGTGMVAFGAQIGRVSAPCLAEVGAAMATLNRDAGELMVAHGAHAATDVTGFGLAGHLVEMARGSGASVELDLARLPVFGAAAACLEREILSGAIERNQEYAMAWVRVADPAAEPLLPILYDPQTSGGMLVALAPGAAEAFVAAMKEKGHAATSIIGRVMEKAGAESEIIVIGAELKNLIGIREDAIMDEKNPNANTNANANPTAAFPGGSCCDHPPVFDDAAPVADPLAIFKDFMKAANAPGLIDAKSKKLMAIALSIAHKCEPCLKSHLQSALKMKISQAEIDEAANLAIAFGGCTAMMFYKTACASMGLE
jgi:selenide,water dikinase